MLPPSTLSGFSFLVGEQFHPALHLDPSRIVAKNRPALSFAILWDRRREFPGTCKTGAGLFSQFRLKSHGTAPLQHYEITRRHVLKFLNHFKKSRLADPLEIKIIQARHSFFAFLWDGSGPSLQNSTNPQKERYRHLPPAIKTLGP